MRRSILKTAQSAARALRAEDTYLHSRAVPYICAACRRTAATPPSQSPTATQRRPLTTTPIPRQPPTQAPTAADSPQPDASPPTHYALFPLTFPHGPPPASPFTPDPKRLRQEFLQLQAKAHPDLQPATQKRHAEALSSLINDAYRTLQDPLKRAQYLLLQHGIDVEDEGSKISGGELLVEVMEAREAVEEADSEAEVGVLREENGERIAGSVRVLETAFGKGEWEVAAREAVRLRYWMNIEESIRGWEKGMGGGAVHH
ncbi:molecular chaperone [Friedmanniomyces endolithicus]|uniref:Molecular chaperone n=1 Tax=Friedmanniomyces endolithicus TaxID=329885 RepID=A0AAN6JA20_9PEZI|nr:molecular chaperone [Friedmanniomyces endolithicus]KAK0299026.1 molecular chaperone [Friedmanniomyces endolithicus]KAK0322874.1 molecular chaperone [Friedmanniomyces endolithicus]KAK0906606.1 molecular chaperone [Friedmanniomyces endolithicus]KAK0967204.1 molecular chaperone [Friedmanniomyces endolithicus]